MLRPYAAYGLSKVLFFDNIIWQQIRGRRGYFTLFCLRNFGSAWLGVATYEAFKLFTNLRLLITIEAMTMEQAHAYNI